VLSNVFATGNRTVRGLEALSLSIPPTPGQSIVKRPGNQHLATLGAVFEDAGYESLFLYGGYGYFDNMNAYFSANDYQVFDRTAIKAANIHHENIWGVADEDLFDSAIERFDNLYANSKPFFAHLMTTSNHRPYTYPAGRIDIPSGSGREGAVKYTDWAIGHLIDSARQRPWFANTLFVITADHGANARGAGAIPVASYKIPAIFYAPKWIPPRRHDRLTSQIDIPPTLLGLIGLPYESKYMGYDVLRSSPDKDRAFVANYQTLGYLRDGRMVVLKPKRKVEVLPNPLAPHLSGPSHLSDAQLIDEAIAWYQSASLFYRNGFDHDEDHPLEP
jgi:phosphoglycerol transferase MdoB-like AlkP superfamily enzyme